MTYRTGEGDSGQKTVAATPPPVCFCLPRADRLTPLQYRAVFDQGHSTPGRHLVVWAHRTESAACRLGVVTSKRTLRTAVARNRARRLMREAFRLNRGALNEGVDIVLIARARIANANAPEVAADFLQACRRARLLRHHGRGQC